MVVEPNGFTYKKLSDANPDKIAADLFKDTDEDGVPDRLDKSLTLKGCPVDVHGVILDTTKTEYLTAMIRNHSHLRIPIDQNGVAIIPPIHAATIIMRRRRHSV